MYYPLSLWAERPNVTYCCISHETATVKQKIEGQRYVITKFTCFHKIVADNGPPKTHTPYYQQYQPWHLFHWTGWKRGKFEDADHGGRPNESRIFAHPSTFVTHVVTTASATEQNASQTVCQRRLRFKLRNPVCAKRLKSLPLEELKK